MTTKPSSSQHTSTKASKTLFDAIGQLIQLGDEVGRGGEGSVYEVANDSSLVAKIYHAAPLADEHLAKLRAITSAWTSELEKISAWPRTVLFDSVRRKPCGILMSKMVSARPLHELYGTTNRRRNFPDVGWHHLVLAARNVAAAFNTLHSAGIVVGDVNQGNLLVDRQMCVRLIDCDSFQITRSGTTYTCPVGSPHFTPPELQGQRLRDVVRTVNHDRFGLAIVIFHLLFVGRHPYAGRYRGLGDLSIEKAIAESRFAFSRNRAATLVDPPPASLLLDDLPRRIGELFEAAFRQGVAQGNSRPAPDEWIRELELLIQRRQVCKIDPMHVYSPESGHCPWCRIEDVGGPSFFLSSDVPSSVTSLRLAKLDETVLRLPEVSLPALAANRLALPSLAPLERVRPLPKRTAADFASAALAVLLAASLVGAFVSTEMFVGGVVSSLACAGYILVGKPVREKRQCAVALYNKLKKNWQSLRAKARTVDVQHRHQCAEFEMAARDLNQEKVNYLAEGDTLARVVIKSRHTQLDDFLRNLSIRDNYRQIPGMTMSQVTLLEAFGVESAYDVERVALYGIPTVDDATTIGLLNWRSAIEHRFHFKPEHGITLDNLNSIGEAATRRYKMIQARKILMGYERLKVLAEEGKNRLAQSLAAFDVDVHRWRKVADEYRGCQQSRRPFERLLNQSPQTVVGSTAAVLIVALLFYLAK
jgi:DNA-binding helix-hairpin-helix protein with protein kinase domain